MQDRGVHRGACDCRFLSGQEARIVQRELAAGSEVVVYTRSLHPSV